MRSLLKYIFLAGFLLAVSCGGNQKPPTPIDTFKAYTLAYKQKDTTTMKLLLSDASLKMAEQQAAQQGVTVDDIVKNETLFTESQKDFAYRNEKIEGDRATIEVRNAFNAWNTVPFVREDGVWKIDKPGIATQIQQKNDFDNKRLDEMINGNSQDGNFNPTLPQNSTVNPNNSQDPMVISPNNSPDATIKPEVSPGIITTPSVKP